MEEHVKLIKGLRESFLEERLRQEIQVADWAKKIEKLDPNILREVALPEEITLKSLLPELYAEDPDPNTYKEQFQAWLEKAKQINEIAERYDKEAQKCMLEYQQQISS